MWIFHEPISDQSARLVDPWTIQTRLAGSRTVTRLDETPEGVIETEAVAGILVSASELRARATTSAATIQVKQRLVFMAT